MEQMHHRRTIRLPSWDYSWPWWYYITIVANGRAPILGDVVDGETRLSPSGEIVRKVWQAIPGRTKAIELDDWVIMPNHFHGIIIINENFVGAIHESPQHTGIVKPSHEEFVKQRRRMMLSRIIGWFKMNSAKRINLLRGTPGAPLWQRNYYDHIIRNDADLHRIRTYIANNPLQWEIDEENPGNAYR
jgi:putative transposase